MSSVARLDNRTPFAAFHVLLPDGEGGEVELIVVKAAFECSSDGALRVADEPTPVRMVDEARGEPGRSGPLHDHDLVLHKPRVDVLVHGQAHAPYGEPAGELLVEIRIARGPQDILLHKSLVVCGDRRWEGEERDRAAAPEPFTAMPLCWERAFGGMLGPLAEGEEDEDDRAELRNPVGVGFRGARSVDEAVASELPNIEYPDARVASPGDRVRPAGLGPVGRGWAPRLARAGTFDERWKARRWPLRPQDYDPAFDQSAPDDQLLDIYPAGAELALGNLSPAGIWVLRLPTLDLPVHLLWEDRASQVGLRVDTLEIFPERRRLELTGRVLVPVDRRRPPLREIIVGHVTPAWLRARRRGKHYLDFHGTGGVDLSRPYFHG
ncbi:DUF2169 domain-containing protein [Pseudenhygromyxa sp. WMMC2535]|uniref:DUF2169 family type VI secretion system accessory protein n=1 Tax=Pseudenhygromyxa sp. WMMC2535 TaxID=2712867 RepID=UPI0015528CCB|nr:DUF2169 domain-containing protein [Pseudenhygromyxa sp. WMMC2535]NVB42735.1 DUF2169 domain-containing protein [Pseudenhygromyxa sp. WMMC2535]